MRPAAVAVLVALVGGGCGDVPLLDPSEGVALAGAYFQVHVVDAAAGARVGLRGHAYGFESGDAAEMHYLDAGRVLVAGRPAEREFVRPAEPVYVFDGEMPTTPQRLGVQVHGSEAVPACTLTLGLPIVTLPETGRLVDRDADLVLPVEFGSEPLPAGQNISVKVRLVSAGGPDAGTSVTLERDQVGSSLVIPSALLGLMPEGATILAVTAEWDQTVSRMSAPPCAPELEVQARFEAAQPVLLY